MKCFLCNFESDNIEKLHIHLDTNHPDEVTLKIQDHYDHKQREEKEDSNKEE